MGAAWHSVGVACNAAMLWGRWLGVWCQGVRWWLLGEGLLLEGVNGWWLVVMVAWCDGGWVDGGETDE